MAPGAGRICDISHRTSNLASKSAFGWHYTSAMFATNSLGSGVRVTALALALVLPTTAIAGPPEAAVTEGPQPIETPAPAALPPPTVAQAEPAPTPIDDRKLMMKKAGPGIAMTSVGFGVMVAGYLFTQAYVGMASLGLGDEPVDNAELEALRAPIVGPFIASNHADTASDKATYAASGLLQLLGFGIGVAGAVWTGKVVRDHRSSRLSLGGGGVTLRF